MSSRRPHVTIPAPNVPRLELLWRASGAHLQPLELDAEDRQALETWLRARGYIP